MHNINAIIKNNTKICMHILVSTFLLFSMFTEASESNESVVRGSYPNFNVESLFADAILAVDYEFQLMTNDSQARHQTLLARGNKLFRLDLFDDAAIAQSNDKLEVVNHQIEEQIELLHEFDKTITSVYIDKNSHVFVATSNNYWDRKEACDIYFAKKSGQSFKKINQFYGGCPVSWSITDVDYKVFFSMYGPHDDVTTKQLWQYNILNNQWQLISQFKNENNRHLHLVYYDTFANILWTSLGDGGKNKGIYLSSDEGINWQKIAQLQPTSMVSTAEGIYIGSDNPKKSNIKYYDYTNEKFKTVVDIRKQNSQLGGSVYDLLALKNDWVLAAFMKYPQQTNHASIWLGKQNNWYKVIEISADVDKAINLSSFAYVTENVVLVNGFLIDIEKLMSSIN